MTTIDSDSRQVGSIAIFPRALYKNGVMQVHLDRYIVPAMCMLGKGYTKYEREAAMSLSREASQILYVRLCRFLDFGSWSPSVDE
ncbi:MAG: RepB family plasmid replication initiator protein, partial [Sphingobacteriaceae bacterium]